MIYKISAFVIVILISILIVFLLFKSAEEYNAQNSASAGSTAAYARLSSYGDYSPYGGGYEYADVDVVGNSLLNDDSYVLKRCAAGPYTYSSNADMAAMCSTIPQDALDKVDCYRVAKVRYQSPAFGSCGSCNTQMSPDYRVTGAPALKYPIFETIQYPVIQQPVVQQPVVQQASIVLCPVCRHHPHQHRQCSCGCMMKN